MNHKTKCNNTALFKPAFLWQQYKFRKRQKEFNKAADAVGAALEGEENDLKREITAAQTAIYLRLEKMNKYLKTAKQDAKAGIQSEIDKLRGQVKTTGRRPR